jgi:hypothetical protein
LQCRNCGDVVDPLRVELGYDYCLKEECQRRCLKAVELAALGVNKAADYYVRADEVLPSRSPLSVAAAADDSVAFEGRASRPAGQEVPRPRSTLERLREAEAQLDEALEQSFRRFSRAEITAKEMDRERDQLTAAFNQKVMGENIRYRSMLRRRSNRAS